MNKLLKALICSLVLLVVSPTAQAARRKAAPHRTVKEAGAPAARGKAKAIPATKEEETIPQAQVAPGMAMGDGHFGKGDHLLGANIGLKFLTGQVALSYDCGVVAFGRKKNWTFGLGPYLGVNPLFGSLGVRLSLHGEVARKATVYCGLVLGAMLFWPNDLWDSGIFPTGDLYGGFRYMFNEHWGINVEISPTFLIILAKPVLSVGVSCMI